MFDTHCHLDDAAYAADVAEVLARAERAGIRGILVPSCIPAQWESLPVFCRMSPLLHFALGIHPWYIAGLPRADREQALDMLVPALRASGALAVGECGLDSPYAKRHGVSLDEQAEVLEAHLAAAHACHLPIVLHCVRAHGRLLEHLERRGPLPASGVLHSYGGPAELVPRYAALGLYFSFAGIITQPGAERPKRALKAIPDERLLLESDGPDQRPAGVSEARSEPAHIALTLQAAAALRETPPAELDELTTRNAQRLFTHTESG